MKSLRFKVCPHCGKDFEAVGRQKFCTYACTIANYEQNRRANEAPEKKERRLKQVREWGKKNADVKKAHGKRYFNEARDYYIVRLLRQQGKEITPENMATKRLFLNIKRKMRAAKKRRNKRND